MIDKEGQEFVLLLFGGALEKKIEGDRELRGDFLQGYRGSSVAE